MLREMGRLLETRGFEEGKGEREEKKVFLFVSPFPLPLSPSLLTNAQCPMTKNKT
jgi:hypothetical protein